MKLAHRFALARSIGNRGLSGMIGTIIGVVIAIIVIVAVTLPVTEEILTNLTTNGTVNGTAQVTGTTATVINLIPLFLGLAALVTVAALFS